MRIDVADIAGAHVCINESFAESTHGAVAVFVRSDNMACVTRSAAANNLGDYWPIASHRMLQLFEDHDHCPFSHHKAVSVGAERTACLLGGIIPSREGHHIAKAG